MSDYHAVISLLSDVCSKCSMPDKALLCNIFPNVLLLLSPQPEASISGDGEDRSTPGRLQAIWPPTKEEKVGLKYTEAGNLLVNTYSLWLECYTNLRYVDMCVRYL